MAIVKEETIIKGVNDIDLDKSLKDLFDRTALANAKDKDKKKVSMVKTEINNRKIVNYIPEKNIAKGRFTNSILKRRKKNKKNEKELDIEISKLLDEEYKDEKVTSRDIDEIEKNGIETAEKIKHYREEEQRKYEKEREYDEKIRLEEEKALEEEKEREEEEEKERQKDSQEQEDNKPDSQNEDELDIEKDKERELELREDIKEEELEETDREDEQQREAQTEIEEENRISRLDEIINDIISSRENNYEQNEDIQTHSVDVSNDQNENWNIQRIESRSYNSEQTIETVTVDYGWNFNGILTIISDGESRTEIFNNSGKADSYQEAEQMAMQAKTDFINMVNSLAQSGDYCLTVKALNEDKTLLYEEGNMEGHEVSQNENCNQESQSHSFVESLANSQSNGNQGMSLSIGGDSGGSSGNGGSGGSGSSGGSGGSGSGGGGGGGGGS